MEQDTEHAECWWSISETELMRMLRRCFDGDDPDLVYAKAYVNSDHEDV